MAVSPVRVFFYGSYINRAVLREVDMTPSIWEPAHLAGFDIAIAPRANLVPSDQYRVYGVLTQATHSELHRLYAHAEHVLGEVYLPEAVLVERLVGGFVPALCYRAHTMVPRPADAAYVARIVEPARALDFPAWYVERLQAFNATAESTP